MSRPPIRTLDLAGSPEAIGHAHGAAHAEEIRAYTRDRVALVASGLWSGGPITEADVIDIADTMVDAHQRFHAGLHAEMTALAKAAGISVPEAIIVGGFTDFVDTVRAVVGGELPTSVVEDDCTAVIVPDHRAEGAGFLAQTWDMHDSATDHVVMLRVQPDDAPAARVFTTTGCLGQMGMNSEGVCIGINNLTCLDGRPGVTWTSVVRAMLQTASADEALQVLLDADLAGAHNYLIFDRAGNGYNIEAMPSVRPVTKLTDAPLIHTNHTLDPESTALQARRDPTLLASSITRLAKATELLSNGPIDAARLESLTREPEAICQRARDPYRMESSGAAIMRPATAEFWACWGRPVDNEYQEIEAPGG